MRRTRGRPKTYDAKTALQAAGQVFWTKGFSATSLDDLAEAMAMNRPSIYRAFGDKNAIYHQALVQFSQSLDAEFAQTMSAESDIRLALTKFYRAALRVYTSGSQPKGCMVMNTAATAATCHPEIQAELLKVIQGLDQKIAKRFEQAREAKQLSAAFDVKARATIAQSLLHSLSIRARAGEAPHLLRRMIKSGVELILS